MVLDGLSSNAITRKYRWGLDLSGPIHGTGGIGGLIAAVETQGTSVETDDRRYWLMMMPTATSGICSSTWPAPRP